MASNKMINEKINVLIPDGEFGNTRRVLFCLKESGYYRVFILSSNKEDINKHSRYCEKFYHSDESGFGAIRLHRVVNIILEERIDILFPTHVDGCQFVLNNLVPLKKLTRIALLPEIENYNLTDDKDLFGKFCANNNIPTPKTTGIYGLEILKEIQNFNFPVLLKPRIGFGGRGIIKFGHREILEKYICDNLESLKHSYIVQQYLDIQEIDVNILCENGEILIGTVQRGIIPPNRQFSFSTGVEIIKSDMILENVRQIFKKLRWSGLAHVDLLYSKVTGEIFVLEINPRVWGTIIASLRAGINFPDLLLQKSIDSNFNDIPDDYYVVKYAELNRKLLLGIILKTSPILFSESNISFLISDPMPMVMSLVYSLKRKIRYFLLYFLDST